MKPEKEGRKISWAIVVAVLVAGVCAAVAAQAASDAKLEFEVASVKPATLATGNSVMRPGPQGGPGTGDPGRLTYKFSTIRDLIMDAYGVKHSQIEGGASWLDTERFDIVAKVPSGATKEQVKVMLQNLLAERFKLALRRETKDLSIYALVVDAKGAKLKESSVPDAAPGIGSEALSTPHQSGLRGMKLGTDGCPETPPMAAAGRAGTFMMMTPGGECMISSGVTMDELAAQLSNRFDRPVVDETGLKGKYDFRLHYDASDMPAGRGGPKDALEPGPPVSDAANRDSAGGPSPSIFAALQEQLGLRLEARKGPVELLVIDHVLKTPTRN